MSLFDPSLPAAVTKSMSELLAALMAFWSAAEGALLAQLFDSTRHHRGDPIDVPRRELAIRSHAIAVQQQEAPDG